MRNLITILALLALSLPASAAEAEYYTWVDENGVVNYSQRNPQGIEARYVGPGQRDEEAGRPGRRPGAQEGEAGDADVADSDDASSEEEALDEDVESEVAQQRAAIDAKIAETRRQNCEIGKRNLAQLEAFARVRVTGDDGQERVLSDQEKQSRIQQARETIRENCSAG